MIPREYSSGTRQRLGALSKQGNPFLHGSLVEFACDLRIDSTLQSYLSQCVPISHFDCEVSQAAVLALDLVDYRIEQRTESVPGSGGEGFRRLLVNQVQRSLFFDNLRVRSAVAVTPETQVGGGLADTKLR